MQAERNPENIDPSFLLSFIRQNSCFDADLLSQIIEEWKAFKRMGLTPEEAVELAEDVHSRFLIWHKKRYGDSAGKVMDWLEGERENRLILLKEPRKPLIWGDENKDTLLCPCCESNLMGGYKYDSEYTMYQCPHCGQPIDTSKTVFSEEKETEYLK